MHKRMDVNVHIHTYIHIYTRIHTVGLLRVAPKNVAQYARSRGLDYAVHILNVLKRHSIVPEQATVAYKHVAATYMCR